MTFFEPLDLQGILINSLAGSIEIFMFIAFISIGAITASLKIPKSVTLVFLGLFAVILADFFPALYLLVVVIAGMTASHAISKVVTR
ncbi:hypothetical protein LCGC14_2207480 [marine sediment metagenome]|uniref:Uncharacterized protein n=1 Tax=marine sediment metagenome TaxID=412755 RepID=A0A0F9E281_9ZZZZ